MKANTMTVSTVYTFAMKFVYVQVHGVAQPAKILADTAEEAGTHGASDATLTLKLNGQQVGKFKGNLVDGWWIQDET